MTNKDCNEAKKAKKDEFYIGYEDIKAEINLYFNYNKNTFRNKIVLCPCDDPSQSNYAKFFVKNFLRLGLKKLICTCYSKNGRGKIMVLAQKDIIKGVDVNALPWKYLDGNGDFRSEEITKLRDKVDIVVTGPPFSLFNEFFAWLQAGNVKFIVTSNQLAALYKNIFPYFVRDEVWFGGSVHGGTVTFRIPKEYPLTGTECKTDKHGNNYVEVKGVRWFTNIEYGKRYQDMTFKTMAENIANSKHEKIRKFGYRKYDNCNAIDVPFTDAIPSDYDGIMGVPLTFLDKYNPDEYEILGKLDNGPIDEYNLAVPTIGGKAVFKRIAIRKRRKNVINPAA